MAKLAVEYTTRVLSNSSISTPIVGDLSATDRVKVLYRRALVRVVLKVDDKVAFSVLPSSDVGLDDQRSFEDKTRLDVSKSRREPVARNFALLKGAEKLGTVNQKPSRSWVFYDSFGNIWSCLVGICSLRSPSLRPDRSSVLLH